MKKFDSFFTVVAIIIAIAMCAIVINWLGWVGITMCVGAGIIFGIAVIGMVESQRK